MKRAIYPGSFDPLTLGHIDIIERSSRLVDELIVAVLINSAKNSLFSINERVSMIKEAICDIPNVSAVFLATFFSPNSIFSKMYFLIWSRLFEEKLI